MRMLQALRVLAVCAVGLSSLGVSAIASGSSGRGDHWYLSKGSSCVTRKGTPWARVSVIMYADDFATTNVQAFKLSARLVPTGAGLNVTRSWTNARRGLTLVGPHKALMTVYAPVPDDLKDWDLQIHVTWDRQSHLDWENQLTVKKFNTTTCPVAGAARASAGSGSLPDPVQATPNAG